MSRGRLWVLLDLAVALTLAATAAVQVWSWDSRPEGGPTVHTVLALASTLPLLARRRYAVAVLLTVVVAAWVQLELGGGLGQPFFALVIALYASGAHAPRPWTYAGPASVAMLALLVDVPRLRDGDPWDEVVPAWFVLVGVWGFGRWMRQRTRVAEELRERTETAERERHELSVRAVAEERARIARELHDLVAHSMGVIVIQAQGAQRALDTSPARARDALVAIETAGRSGLAEMRRLLDLLSEDADEPGAASTAPQPTLGGIADLVDQLRVAGLPVSLEVEGDVQALAPGLELAGYRLVQEALTNTLKHAGEVPVEVRVTYAPDFLEIGVTDHGSVDATPADLPDSGSRGLAGMRERVTLYGGTLRAGPHPGGGFGVHALLPLDGQAT